MSDQCQHCTVKGDWDKCQSTKCFHHENWGWLQLKDQRNNLQAKVQELETGVKTIYNTMGPETPDCCGCKVEWSVSMEICKSLLEAKPND